MGQYYRFVNQTKREVSQISLPFNFGMPYAKSLENYESKEIEAMFRFVVRHNPGWDEADDLVAIGDYGAAITFESVRTQPSQFNWENYQPEHQPPLKIEAGEQIW